MRIKKIIFLLVLISVFFITQENVKAVEIQFLEPNSGLKQCINDNYKELLDETSGVPVIRTEQFTTLICSGYTFDSQDSGFVELFENLTKVVFDDVSFEGVVHLKNIPTVEIYRSNFSNGLEVENVDELSVFTSSFSDVVNGIQVDDVIFSENIFSNGVLIDTFSELMFLENKKVNNLTIRRGEFANVESNNDIQQLNIDGVKTAEIISNSVANITYNNIKDLILHNNTIASALTLQGDLSSVSVVNNQLNGLLLNSLATENISIIEETIKKISINNSIIKFKELSIPGAEEIYVEDSDIQGDFLIYNCDVFKIILVGSDIENLIIKNGWLQELILDSTNISSLELEGLDNLRSISIKDGEIPKSLNFYGAPNLQQLIINNTLLETIDLKNNKELIELNLKGNKLTSIDLSKNKLLNVLDLSDNNLYKIDLSNNESLVNLNLELNDWNTKGTSKVNQNVKVNGSFKFIESIMLPTKLAEGALFTNKVNKKYYSSNESIATVDEKGNIKTLKEGKVDIILEYTITSTNGTETISSTYYEINSLDVSKEAIKNPDTGSRFSYISIILLVLICGLSYLLIRKKMKFPKHN